MVLIYVSITPTCMPLLLSSFSWTAIMTFFSSSEELAHFDLRLPASTSYLRYMVISSEHLVKAFSVPRLIWSCLPPFLTSGVN